MRWTPRIPSIAIRLSGTSLARFESGANVGADASHEVGIAEDPIAHRHTVLPRVDCFVPEHQPREVDRELVGWLVRADRITELALVAEVDDVLVHGQIEPLERVGLTHDVGTRLRGVRTLRLL